MFFLPAVSRHAAFREGVRDMVPVGVGVAMWGVMTGVAMIRSGLSLSEAAAMAVLVFAGSAQLAAIPLIVGGAPIWVILAAAFCVNLRFVVFSLHLRPYLMHLPRGRRMVRGYLTGDMTYALFTNRFPEPATTPSGRAAQDAYLAGSCFANWCSWIPPSLAGIGLGHLVPTHWGLGFAAVLCLLGMLCSLVTTRLRLLAACLAGGVAVATYAMPLKLNIVLAIAAAVAAALVLESSSPAVRRKVAE